MGSFAWKHDSERWAFQAWPAPGFPRSKLRFVDVPNFFANTEFDSLSLAPSKGTNSVALGDSPCFQARLLFPGLG